MNALEEAKAKIEAYPDKLIPVFAYGTLRVGFGNHRWCQDAINHAEIDAVTRGKLWFSYDYGSYPVAKFSVGPDTIIGDVLFFRRGASDFADVIHMEIGANYRLAKIKYEHQGISKNGFGFHYNGSTEDRLLIPDGDWASAVRRNTREEV